MKAETAKLADAVTRTVRRYDKGGQPYVSVILSRVYDTSAADLWDAMTSAERLPRWFAKVEGELKPGGKYQVIGNAGGTITACEAPGAEGRGRFAATWEFGGGVSWIDVLVEPAGSGARMTLEHIALDDGNPHFEKFGPGAVGVGWELGLVGMAMYLAAGAPAEGVTEAGMAWTMSDEGKAFMKTSAAHWGDADAQGGAPAETASRRAAHTAAFYCGEPPPGSAHPGTSGG
jgi:uncharacterized protein YndB with AHSA1/START domain